MWGNILTHIGVHHTSTRQQINIMLSHCIVNVIAVTGQLSLIDGVINAIDVQVAKIREISSKKLSSFLSST
jgi:hypothetical protein